MLDRDELGRKIVEVAKNHADGYLRAITSFSTEAERDTSQKCAAAASNTGYFLLQALGYSNDEIRSLTAAAGQTVKVRG